RRRSTPRVSSIRARAFRRFPAAPNSARCMCTTVICHTRICLVSRYPKSIQSRGPAMTIHAETHSARADARDVANLVTRLTADYGERAITSQAIRDQHSHGEGLADAGLPDVVVFPHTNEEV